MCTILPVGHRLQRLREAWPVSAFTAVYLSLAVAGAVLWLWPGRLKFDQLVHAFGFGVTTWLFWQGLAAALRLRHRPRSRS